MRKTLYIFRGGFDQNVLPSSKSDQEEASFLLIQDGVKQQQGLFDCVFALSEDVAARKVSSSLPAASYRDMLRMIFEADTVAVLSLSPILISGMVV